MRIHFSVVGENTLGYINMIKALLFSIRTNAGKYRQCPVTAIFIGSSIDEQNLHEIMKRFKPVDIVTMPPIGSIPYTNKYNAFYALKESDYDVLILLDCDTVVLNKLDGIVDGMTLDEPVFSARPIKPIGANFVGYKKLLHRYANLTPHGIESYGDPIYLTKYPLFNAGVIVVNQKAVKLLQEDAIRIIYNLYDDLMPATLSHFIRLKIMPILAGAYFVTGNRSIKYFIASLMKMANVWYPKWNCEQIGLSLAVLKHRISIRPLSNLYNWTFQHFPEEDGPPYIYHYLRNKKQINLDNLFTGNWIENYLQSQSASKKALAELIYTYSRSEY